MNSTHPHSSATHTVLFALIRVDLDVRRECCIAMQSVILLQVEAQIMTKQKHDKHDDIRAKTENRQQRKTRHEYS